jgi:hypothetical protein
MLWSHKKCNCLDSSLVEHLFLNLRWLGAPFQAQAVNDIYTWALSITRWKCGRFRIPNRPLNCQTMQENSYVGKMGMLLLSAGSRAQIHKKHSHQKKIERKNSSVGKAKRFFLGPWITSTDMHHTVYSIHPARYSRQGPRWLWKGGAFEREHIT